ncbi:hypothetical protein OG765_03320 [Streptomyces sp. NBC_00555]|uniref:hypothetical protein n=1 Tax=Streptomyces sp. NBC_00555 TaxID=2903662 RepID=UPI00224E7CBF|nr:hypothetical protein [Streptomyces sp. NBC_00555]MCX5010018.1 hypothetical protein [Streptomyces sp. NBC_00555]
MNDPITLAATDREDRHGIPDTTPPGAPGTQPVRTLLDTAATCRPLEEVTALVSLLKDTGQLPNPGHEALRTAAVTRPVHEVREMVALLGEPPHEVDAADITLRAAAVGRSIEDVALLVTILGTESEEAREAGVRAEPPGPPEPAEEPYEEEPYQPPYQELHDAPYAKPRGHTERHPHPHPHPGPQPAPEPARSGPPVLRHVLRWPVAFALLVSGALHLPEDMAALPSAAPVGFLPLLVTVLCVGFGALLALRDTTAVWRAGAATAVGVVALHVFGGAVAFDPLAGAVGGSLAWAGVVAVLSAAAGAVLAGLALRNRREGSA